MACFNCGTTDGVKRYNFDPDLPTLAACQICVVVLALGDEELLADLRPRRRRPGAPPTVGDRVVR